MGALQPWHWLIIIAAFILLFGAKRLPDAARSLGKSMRIFKSEIKEMQVDGKDSEGREGEAPKPAPSPTPIASERVEPTPSPAPERSAEQRPA